MEHSELLNNVLYDPQTGIFIRQVTAGNSLAGSTIGNIDKKGYLKAMVLGQYVKLHRLAWFYVHGVWPSQQIDHINQVKTDNRLANLRDCGTAANCLNQLGKRSNNKAGYQGVHKITKTGRYRAACSIQGVKHHLGVFLTPEEAHQAYLLFKSPLLPERTQ